MHLVFYTLFVPFDNKSQLAILKRHIMVRYYKDMTEACCDSIGHENHREKLVVQSANLIMD